MTRIVTIHPAQETHRYGFESSQVYRAQIARHIGAEYIHLITSPQIRPDWKKDLLNLGFLNKELLCVPHSFSDIGHAEMTVKPEHLTLSEGDHIELNEEGFVISVTLGDGSGIYYYTTGPFLFEDIKRKELYWYNENRELALEARFVNPHKEPSPVNIFYAEYIYRIDGEICSEEDLLIKFLARWAQQTDLFIRDQQFVPKPNLLRYMENTNKNYYEVIHENIMQNIHMANLRQKTKYLVASESLAERLANEGYQIKFLPPMFTENPGNKEHIGPITNYCLVGNMNEAKNVEYVIETFIELYNRGSKAHITFYGGSKERLKQLKQRYDLTPNIQLKGHVSDVPYYKHQCYLSASYAELFANACIEASNQGLLALLSNVDVAHRFYASKSNGIRLFSNKKQLMKLIEEMEHDGYKQSNSENIALASHYSLDKVAQKYRELIKRTTS